MQQRQSISTRKGVLLVISMTLLSVALVALIIAMFHQKVVPSHVHDSHPAAAASSDLFWADSERLKLNGPYNYTSAPFTPAQSDTYQGAWTCYPSALTNTPSYDLNIVVTDQRTHVEQSALVACNEVDVASGTTALALVGADPYIVTIQSAGPWTFSIGQP